MKWWKLQVTAAMILQHKVFLSGSDGGNTYMKDYRLLKKPERFARVHSRRPVSQHCCGPLSFNNHTRLGENLKWTQGEVMTSSSPAAQPKAGVCFSWLFISLAENHCFKCQFSWIVGWVRFWLVCNNVVQRMTCSLCDRILYVNMMQFMIICAYSVMHAR